MVENIKLQAKEMVVVTKRGGHLKRFQLQWSMILPGKTFAILEQESLVRGDLLQEVVAQGALTVFCV